MFLNVRQSYINLLTDLIVVAVFVKEIERRLIIAIALFTVKFCRKTIQEVGNFDLTRWI